MTREERAIQILEQRECCRECVVGNCTCAECDEAFDMAIKALEQEPCEDAISREYLFKVLDDFCGHDRTATITLDTLADLVYDMPPVKPQEPTGHWIYDRTRDWDGECKYECSECGMGSDVDFAYCMRCGAKMVEPQESEEV